MSTTLGRFAGGRFARRPQDSTPPDDAGISKEVLERGAWSVVWFGVLAGGTAIWATWSTWPPAGVVAPLVVLAGIAGLGATWLVRSPRAPLFQLLAMAGALVATAIPQATAIHVRRYYSTDSGAFNQYAGQLALHGKNPYTTSMAGAGRFLQVPADFWTYTVAGGHVASFSYPAGSFLVQLPAMALGFHHEVVDWMDLYAWLVTGLLLFALLPVAARSVAALVTLTPALVGIFSSGGTDAVFLPFLVLALWRWDRFALGARGGVARWIGPVALGLACSIKQTPWFCLPFLAVGVVIEARNANRHAGRVLASYLAIVAVVFFLANAPFIVDQPTAWARGTLLPLRTPLIADGQGLITLALHGIARGASLPMLTVAGILAGFALLVAFVAWYPVLKRTWLLLLPVVFFVAPRSLSSYLLDFFPVAIVAAVSVSPGERVALARGESRFALAVPLVAAASTIGSIVVALLAFLSPPLQLTVVSMQTTGGNSALHALRLNVQNRTGHPVSPHVMVAIGSGPPDGFWALPYRRQLVLGPHASATITLYPNQYTPAPLHGSYWIVEAYTTSPEALSTTPLQRWRLKS